MREPFLDDEIYYSRILNKWFSSLGYPVEKPKAINILARLMELPCKLQLAANFKFNSDETIDTWSNTATDIPVCINENVQAAHC